MDRRKSLTILFILVVMLAGCFEETTTRAERAFRNRRDSLKTASVLREMELLTELGMDSSALKTTVVRDARFFDAGDTVHVYIEKKFDTSKRVIVPKAYLEHVKVEYFEMFQPYYEIGVLCNGKTLAMDTVRAKDVWDNADSRLRAWGVLAMPRVKIMEDSVVLSFDHVIPLSDVGYAVEKKYRFR